MENAVRHRRHPGAARTVLEAENRRQEADGRARGHANDLAALTDPACFGVVATGKSEAETRYLTIGIPLRCAFRRIGSGSADDGATIVDGIGECERVAGKW